MAQGTIFFLRLVVDNRQKGVLWNLSSNRPLEGSRREEAVHSRKQYFC